MALAYPEGECFFVRNGLRARKATHYSYDANKPDHFKNHMMVEYIWNRPAHSSWDGDSGYDHKGHWHPRTAYTITRVLLRSYHGAFNYLPFSYGRTESSIRTRVQHELCVRPRTFDDWWYGASDEVNLPSMLELFLLTGFFSLGSCICPCLKLVNGFGSM